MTDAIISIKPRHVENILSGEKTVELRTRGMNLPVGSRLWIYTTLPVGRVKISAEIDFIEIKSPKEIWKKYGRKICIPKKEFDEYTGLRKFVVAIGLRNIKRLDDELSLAALRAYEENFQPPQFYSKLNPDRPLYSEFHKKVRSR